MNTERKFTVVKQCMIAIGIVINIVGAFLALNLRLPVYLDSIGTVLVSGLLGPVYGMVTGVLGSMISGITFDIYSLYYAPVQLFTGLMAGLVFRTVWLKGWRLPIGSLAVSLPTSVVSAMITAFLFGGITSSGSSYLVVLMNNLGMNLTLSCFLVQVLTDYGDKLIAVILVTATLRSMTPEMKLKIRGGRNGAV
ncbi:ECF transporter S component [Frisingicoccus sp.]|uniref:ECF transporter S component n=1 Tax=Frisingicoccus sp. TaxID=1918627 RepID=UPI002E797479|nr:ECF transporter S component [Frisingicoccus sp.]MEE0751750.1 ECF transporter S component [Frisingicoccus sp.]